MINTSYLNELDSVSLEDWILLCPTEEEKRVVFINLDIALKYIHDHGYCVEKMHPAYIKILNNEYDHIKFDTLVELSSNSEVRRETIKEDLFNSAVMQIGLYFFSDGLGLSINQVLDSLSKSIVVDNFDSYAQFLPQGDVPYYRGIIVRGASVYFNEFVDEKRKRDLEELDKQFGVSSEKEFKTVQLKKLSNDKINDSIYKQINGLKDAAFINMLLIPTIGLIIITVFAFIAWIISGI